jgi:hypothetical protein
VFRKGYHEFFGYQSRHGLLEFVRESDILGFKGKPSKITVVDQGERKIWSSLQKSQLKPPFCYFHVHMTDDYMFLKLHQIVDITSSNNGIQESAILFIKDSKIIMKNTYYQVCESIWCHLQSLDDKERKEFIYSDDPCCVDYASDHSKLQRNSKILLRAR